MLENLEKVDLLKDYLGKKNKELSESSYVSVARPWDVKSGVSASCCIGRFLTVNRIHFPWIRATLQ